MEPLTDQKHRWPNSLDEVTESSHLADNANNVAIRKVTGMNLAWRLARKLGKLHPHTSMTAKPKGMNAPDVEWVRGRHRSHTLRPSSELHRGRQSRKSRFRKYTHASSSLENERSS